MVSLSRLGRRALNIVAGSKNDDPWRKNFRATHPFLSASKSHPEKLRLVLGVGRSGTTWVSRVLSKRRAPTRFIPEPLFHIEPRLPFPGEGDHTAVGYEKLPASHPLLMAYELLTHREFDSQRLKVTEREDANWEICLVKEVHALLGTEGLLRRWKTPAVFILRDPVYIADSLFGAQTLQTHYLLRENLAVQQPEFLDRFARGRQRTVRRLLADVELRTPRERTILTRVMTMQLLQEMFALLAAEYAFVKALPYDEFCSAPREAFQTAARTLAISWDKDMENYLDQTMQADGTSGDPYSIMRNTSEQKHRPFKFFTPEEIAACRWVLGAMMG